MTSILPGSDFSHNRILTTDGVVEGKVGFQGGGRFGELSLHDGGTGCKEARPPVVRRNAA